MPYRSPDHSRIQAQASTIFQFAGHTAIWRDYISASAGVVAVGQGVTPFYREQVITGLFAPLPVNMEAQTPAGMLAATQFQVTTREPLNRQDELLWRGDRYRIDSDPSPAELPGLWVAIATRGFSA